MKFLFSMMVAGGQRLRAHALGGLAWHQCLAGGVAGRSETKWCTDGLSW